MWNVKIITAYPEMFPGVLGHSVIGKALNENIWTLDIYNLHSYGLDNRKTIDDSPFGGGPGMVIRPDVVEKTVLSVNRNFQLKFPLIYLTPSGKPLKQADLVKYSKNKGIIILCGHFEGIDARVIDSLCFERISLGDYILSGGEIAAQVLVEGCVRLIPGVLGHPESIMEESFCNDLLEYPQYTRPQVWNDKSGINYEVPDILLSGHHKKIKEWREKKSIEITKKYRSDLLKKNIKEKL